MVRLKHLAKNIPSPIELLAGNSVATEEPMPIKVGLLTVVAAVKQRRMVTADLYSFTATAAHQFRDLLTLRTFARL